MTEQERYRKRAAALQFDAETDVAPKVTATGKGYVAELLSELNINEQIPEELYQVVAEVFAYIYQVDQKAAEKE